MANAIPRKRTCVSSLLNAGRLKTGNFKRLCHFRSEAYSMVESEPKDEVATIEGEFKLLCPLWGVK